MTETPFVNEKYCEHWLLKGSCKYGESCRLSHDIATLARKVSVHSHLLGPDQAHKRKKFFCDICQKKSAARYRCTVGCDYDLCVPCFEGVVIVDSDEEEDKNKKSSEVVVDRDEGR
jgi:hypothetical protein